jgi:hypothetical protein
VTVATTLYPQTKRAQSASAKWIDSTGIPVLETSSTRGALIEKALSVGSGLVPEDTQRQTRLSSCLGLA